MKLLMTLLVRDEQDILRENLEFHLSKGVDQFILMDNLSVDGTPDIAREYERAGYLHYIFQPQDDYSQGEWVTNMVRLARDDFRADWVINSDADEFWRPHTGSIKDALRSLGTGAVATSIARTNFIARSGDSEPFWKRMNIRQAVSRNCFGERLANKVAHRGLSDATVHQGNHAVSFAGQMAPCVAGPMTILHFPIRSRAQFHNKITKGGAAYARNTALGETVGGTWRYLYRLHLEGRFDEFYEQELFSDTEVASGLMSGELLRDDRLMEDLHDIRLRNDVRAHVDAGRRIHELRREEDSRPRCFGGGRW
jgi:Glycosyl transferase family 2